MAPSFKFTTFHPIEIAWPKEDRMSKYSFTAEKHTNEARKREIERAERKLKYAEGGNAKTRIEVQPITYDKEPYGILYVYVPGEDGQDGRTVSVSLSAKDLEALQNATFEARVAVDKATTKIKNQKLSDAKDSDDGVDLMAIFRL